MATSSGPVVIRRHADINYVRDEHGVDFNKPPTYTPCIPPRYVKRGGGETPDLQEALVTSADGRAAKDALRRPKQFTLVAVTVTEKEK